MRQKNLKQQRVIDTTEHLPDISNLQDERIDELIKWKIEAYQRKLTDRLQQSEAKQHQIQSHLKDITDETHREFLTIKDLVVRLTTDVLEQV